MRDEKRDDWGNESSRAVEFHNFCEVVRMQHILLVTYES